MLIRPNFEGNTFDSLDRLAEEFSRTYLTITRKERELYELAAKGQSRKTIESLEKISSEVEKYKVVLRNMEKKYWNDSGNNTVVIDKKFNNNLYDKLIATLYTARLLENTINSVRAEVINRVHEYALEENKRDEPYRIVRKGVRELLSGEPNAELLEYFIRSAKYTLYGREEIDLTVKRPDDKETDASGTPKKAYRYGLRALELELERLKVTKNSPYKIPFPTSWKGEIYSR